MHFLLYSITELKIMVGWPWVISTHSEHGQLVGQKYCTYISSKEAIHTYAHSVKMFLRYSLSYTDIRKYLDVCIVNDFTR